MHRSLFFLTLRAPSSVRRCVHLQDLCDHQPLLAFMVFCLFFSEEGTGVSLKNISHANKNGVINEGFEVEVCI